MIDVRQLRYFVGLGEMLHFGRAAAKLHVTQPPLSRQIAALEAELGVQLVVRKRRAIALTQAGRAFFDASRRILAQIDAACEEARQIDRGEIGSLSIGFMTHAAHSVAAALARRFMAAFPNVSLQLHDMLPTLVGEEVLAGQIDAGILFEPAQVPGLSMRAILRESLCCAMPANHPLEDFAIVPAAALRDQPLIATHSELAPSLRAKIVAYCQEAGFAPRIVMEVQFHQTIASLVAEGIGIAIVPQSLEKVGLPNMAFRPLEAAPSVDNVLLWRTDNPNPLLRSLSELLDHDTPSVS